jgi:hypothetical protein
VALASVAADAGRTARSLVRLIVPAVHDLFVPKRPRVRLTLIISVVYAWFASVDVDVRAVAYSLSLS